MGKDGLIARNRRRNSSMKFVRWGARLKYNGMSCRAHLSSWAVLGNVFGSTRYGNTPLKSRPILGCRYTSIFSHSWVPISRIGFDGKQTFRLPLMIIHVPRTSFGLWPEGLVGGGSRLRRQSVPNGSNFISKVRNINVWSDLRSARRKHTVLPGYRCALLAPVVLTLRDSAYKFRGSTW